MYSLCGDGQYKWGCSVHNTGCVHSSFIEIIQKLFNKKKKAFEKNYEISINELGFTRLQ